MEKKSKSWRQRGIFALVSQREHRTPLDGGASLDDEEDTLMEEDRDSLEY